MMDKKSPNAVGKDGKCADCTANKNGSCAYAMAGQELPCGKKKPNEARSK
jgi:hypothetical protein